MGKPIIKLRFQNGLLLEHFKKDVFDIEKISDLYDFEESENPDFVIFGPYGNDIPPKGNYIRIGYFCENIKPDFSICEWAFGVPHEKEINRTNYKRIQWHGTNPQDLVKPADYDIYAIAESKTKFCNFLYSHKVPYREEFFKQLSKYKKVDAPGKSMNNMASIDGMYKGDKWDIKKQFLSPYKFTIAFENDIFPGYQTEKLYDAMMMNSIPVYCGDPLISDVFNTRGFINTPEYLLAQNSSLSNILGKLGQMDFDDIRPSFLTGPTNKLKRKVKAWMRDYKTKLQFTKIDFTPVIEQIVALDTQPYLYLEYLKEPWFKNNVVPGSSSTRARWIEIFDQLKSK